MHFNRNAKNAAPIELLNLQVARKHRRGTGEILWRTRKNLRSGEADHLKTANSGELVQQINCSGFLMDK